MELRRACSAGSRDMPEPHLCCASLKLSPPGRIAGLQLLDALLSCRQWIVVSSAAKRSANSQDCSLPIILLTFFCLTFGCMCSGSCGCQQFLKSCQPCELLLLEFLHNRARSQRMITSFVAARCEGKMDCTLPLPLD